MAPRWKRFANFIIDTIVAFAILFLLGMIIGFSESHSALAVALNPLISNLLAIAVFLFYPTITEFLFGKTLGKVITQTRVVTANSRKPSFLNLLGRNAARMIPFDALSFLVNEPGWHDSISRTRVIND